jgi:tetratricopeptide (TPR) repeat protein
VQLQEVEEGTETRAGSILGTPSYMAPEVAAGRNDEVDHRSDIYLLGGTLYEILTGNQPRKAATAMDMVRLAVREAPPPPSKLRPGIPKALDAICMKAMAQRREDRYQTALELGEDIQRFVAGEPVSAYPEGLAARAWRWARRHRKVLGRSASAALLVGLVSFGLLKIQQVERHRQEALRAVAHLREQDQARTDLDRFRGLMDEARYYAATTDAVSEHAPYFDPRKGEATAQAALALAGKWGPTLEAFPLPDQLAGLKKDVGDLFLLLAQIQADRATGPEGAKYVVKLLDRAAAVQPPTRGAFRLRARADDQLGDEAKAAEARKRADDPARPTRSLDHFLAAERLRKASVGGATPDNPDRKSWQHDPAPIEQAIAEYRQALAIDPDDYWSHFQLGRCLLGLGRTDEAIAELGACIALRPQSPWGYSVRGFALAQARRFAEAERDLDTAVRLAPDARVPRLNRGVVAWMQKKYEPALEDFRLALQPPDEKRVIEAAYYRAQLHLQLGEVPEALADLNALLEESPDFRPARLFRARVLIAGGDADGGLADLDACLAEPGKPDPPKWELHARRGWLLRRLHSELPADQRAKPSARALATLAVSELQQAERLGGRTPQVFDDLGAMLEMTGRIDQAVNAYSKGIELDPRRARLLVKRAWALDGLGRHDQAAADFAAAVAAEPGNAEAHTGRGYERALQKASGDALREADLAILHGSENYLVLHNVACIYAVLSQAGVEKPASYKDSAIDVLRRAIALWKRSGEGPNEVELIKAEPAFQPLHDHPDYTRLISDAGDRAGS